MATIKDVARVAGVSIATVSATLNGTARVSEKRSQRVWDAVKNVGYTPHGIARSLRLGHTRSIGLIVGDISDPFFTSLVKAVEAGASKAGYTVILLNSDENAEKELNLIKVLIEQRVAGILLAPSGYDAAYLAALSAMVRVPLVLVDRYLPDAAYDAVIVDNQAAARMVTDYLISIESSAHCDRDGARAPVDHRAAGPRLSGGSAGGRPATEFGSGTHCRLSDRDRI